MTLERAIALVELEKDYLLKKNAPESKQICNEIAQALNMAIYALKAMANIERLLKGGGNNG